MARSRTESTDRPVAIDPSGNYETTRSLVGWVPRRDATEETYRRLGFKSGLEIHQQLLTRKKLFCHCPAGIYQGEGEFDAEVIRHMRPTLSEMGEYDGTALMEKKTRKTIVYRIKDETACTYDIDDTPPFKINREALTIATEVALMLRTNIVGELHITRKQYLDGSIPTGFQRTAIVGIEGEIPLSKKAVRIIQISIEEDSCREISDIGHTRVYTTDRLGMPLIESVTYPDMLTPDEVAEAAQYLRLLVRSTDKVRTGMGAAREDVNVSIEGGTRVEIKGVAHIRWIPRLTHNEAFRQKALLLIRDRLAGVIADQAAWKISHCEITSESIGQERLEIRRARRDGLRVVAVNLPRFAGLLSHFTQPGQCFAHELSDRLKVIACLERPNMAASEGIGAVAPSGIDFAQVSASLDAAPGDAQLVFWGPADDVPTALETLEERCRMAFTGVPNETRKSLPDGTTLFERVLPGPDRMYPDTDSAPIPIEESFIEACRANLPRDLDVRWARLREWRVPEDLHVYMLRHRLVPVVEWICREGRWNPRFVSVNLTRAVRRSAADAERRAVVTPQRLQGMFDFLSGCDLGHDVARDMLDELYQHPTATNEALLERLDFQRTDRRAILEAIPSLLEKFKGSCTSRKPDACVRWVMGQLRDRALGNIPLAELAEEVRRSIDHE